MKKYIGSSRPSLLNRVRNLKKMKKPFVLNSIIILLGISYLTLFMQCQNDDDSSFDFPKITNIDPTVYNEIKITCEKYWDLDKMIDSTFEIEASGDEYSVRCEGYSENQLRIFVIRVDKDGKWINSGSYPKP